MKISRRYLITLIGVAAAAWPLAARAQQADRVRRIGVLVYYAEGDAEGQARIAALRQSIRELGWIEGSNVQFDERWSAGDMDRIRAHAAEIVNLKPDVIVATSSRETRELQQQTRTIPIVFIGTHSRSSAPASSGLALLSVPIIPPLHSFLAHLRLPLRCSPFSRSSSEFVTSARLNAPSNLSYASRMGLSYFHRTSPSRSIVTRLSHWQLDAVCQRSIQIEDTSRAEA